MYLQRIELQGFKTFARKTSLEFERPKSGKYALTAIIGPNGSGKSNVADAIRWGLGEQSLKLLRGKKSEDIIFSGSDGRARAGFAEVSLTFNNEDGAMPIDYSEVTITRRLHRNGTSEYELNGKTARLFDIQLLLAKANVGQRSYSVIGQGMVDHILVATPQERKDFFDDATGVKQFQIKRHEAALKLKKTSENFSEVELILRELEPRLKSLNRQVSRLKQREDVQEQLAKLQTDYYKTLWWTLQDEFLKISGAYNELQEKVKTKEAEIVEMEKQVLSQEHAEKEKKDDHVFLEAQKKARELQKSKEGAHEKEFQLQKELEIAKVRAQSSWIPWPLQKIIEELKSLSETQKNIIERVREITDINELKAIISDLDIVFTRSEKLLARLEKPKMEEIKPDPKIASELEMIKKELDEITKEQKALDERTEKLVKEETKERGRLFELGKDLRMKQQEFHVVSNHFNALQIEHARLEERRNSMSREMEEEITTMIPQIKKDRPHTSIETEQTHAEIQRLKYKLQLIGGIEPETIKEFEETKVRFDFLSEQINDLKSAMRDTAKIIDELDDKIHKQSEKLFREINREFQRFFKFLFGGGTCSLVKMTQDELEQEEEGGATRDKQQETDGQASDITQTKEEEEKFVIKESHGIVGIDIQATPPGKKLKALNLLSGGERSLTSIALVSAIMAINPSPFVVLDEVDAALDESNTIRFASILDELRKLTQFIVITHNRATMEKSDFLYGVTMGNEGISRVLSINIEDLAENKQAK